MLGNLSRGLTPRHKQLLYCSCSIPTVMYSFQLWFYSSDKKKGMLKILTSMQCQAALWITGVCCTSPTAGCEALAGLLPVRKLLANLSLGSVTRVMSLLETHPV